MEGLKGVEALGFSTVEGVEDVEALDFSTVDGRSLPPAAGARMGWEPFGGQRRPTVVTL